MTENLFEDNNKGLLLLILPLAVAIIFVYQFWYIIVTILILSLIWQIWQNYQWKKWSLQINPFFNELIMENQGRLTPLDLSVKANLTARSAQNFLDRKAEEYGAQKKLYQDQLIYYFLTANALQSIFEDSEPLSLSATIAEVESLTNSDDDFVDDEAEDQDYDQDYDQEYLTDESDYDQDYDLEEDQEDQELGILNLGSVLDEIDQDENDVIESTTHHEMSIQEMAKLVEVKEDSPLPPELQEDETPVASIKNIAQLIELDQPENITEITTISNNIETEESNQNLSKKLKKDVNYQSLRLKQNELAKRLDIHYNTIGKRKSDPDFSQWTQRRDPEGIAWEYLPKIRLFAPVIDNKQ